MFFKKQICPNCKIGKNTLDLDKRSPVCPYLHCYKAGKCRFYVPIKKSFIKNILNNRKK